VHAWRVDLARAAAATGLSEAERARASSFRRDEDRARYEHAHTALRGILARYLGAPPGSLAFDTRCLRCGHPTHGKPRLLFSAHAWLRFNLSHAGSVALVALARDREVGVDVEALRGDLDLEAMAREAFDAADRQALASAPAKERPALFFERWTRREALLKLSGAGLAGLHAPGAREAGDAWVAALDVGPGSAAAVAAEGPRVPVVRRYVWA
jgi:4'-phosphopantetheinyl transferase